MTEINEPDRVTIAIVIKSVSGYSIYKTTKHGRSIGMSNYFVLDPRGFRRFSFKNLRGAERFVKEVTA